MKTHSPALLVLADGTIFRGRSVGAEGHTVGELVFNTAMTGYQEMLTDPSYTEQIVLLTTSHVGNTGCNLDDDESTRVWASGLVMREMSECATHSRSEIHFSDWLKKHKVVAISDIDTRALTLHLREIGAQNACITTHHSPEDAQVLAEAMPSLKGRDLARVVTRSTIERWHEGLGKWGNISTPLSWHVVVYDFGVKHSILKILYDLGCHITVVPAETNPKDVLALNPDGILLSNGPGDPAACTYAIDAAKIFMDADIPLMGICLGFQILALAAGADVFKMKFGHHGANHPVIETKGQKRVFITSQNHGFAVDENSLPSHFIVTHRSLFDGTLQGIQHAEKPVFGFQGHPEASPGPHDAMCLFEQFIALMRDRRDLSSASLVLSKGEMSL